MKNLTLLSFLIFVLLFTSCNKADSYKITGELTGFPDSTIFYLENSSTQESFDSAIILDNKLEFAGQLLNAPEQVFLRTRVDGHLVYTYLLIGNEKIRISGDIKDFPWDVQISGSKSHSDYDILRNMTKHYDIERDSLVQIFFNLTEEEKEIRSREIWTRINSIDDSTQKIKVGFTKQYINTYPGIIHLGYIKKSLPKDTVQSLYDKLSPEIKTSKYARIVEIYLKEGITEIGDMAHDFEAYNKEGELISFSDIAGHYILLDFTAAYCGPCVQSAEELRLIDETYNDSLEIVSFSGDVKKDIWLESLDRDSVSWISLWDGQGTFSETYIKYGVSGFPTFFLIDPKGKIIDKWVGYGKGSLENKLSRFKNI